MNKNPAGAWGGWAQPPLCWLTKDTLRTENRLYQLWFCCDQDSWKGQYNIGGWTYCGPLFTNSSRRQDKNKEHCDAETRGLDKAALSVGWPVVGWQKMHRMKSRHAMLDHLQDHIFKYKKDINKQVQYIVSLNISSSLNDWPFCFSKFPLWMLNEWMVNLQKSDQHGKNQCFMKYSGLMFSDHRAKDDSGNRKNGTAYLVHKSL